MIKGKRFPSTASLVLAAAFIAAGPLVLSAFGGIGTGTTNGGVPRGGLKAGLPKTEGKTSPSTDANHNSGTTFMLVALKHETVGTLTRITVESSAPPLYSVSRPNDRLIVIDLPGGDGSKLAQEYSLSNETVDSIRVRNAGSPVSEGVRPNSAALTRIEIAVKSRIKDRSALAGNSLVLELSPQDSESQNAAAEGAEAKRTDNAGVYVYPVSVKSTSKPDPRPASDQATLKPATVLRGVRTEPSDRGVRILLDADGKAEFKDFTLTDPARIVVDVLGVRCDFGSKTMEVDSAGIDRVRVGQPNSKTVRIVLDAKQKVAYRVVREGALLVIEVGDGSAPPAIHTAESANKAEEMASRQQQPQEPKAVNGAGDSKTALSSSNPKASSTKEPVVASGKKPAAANTAANTAAAQSNTVKSAASASEARSDKTSAPSPQNVSTSVTPKTNQANAAPATQTAASGQSAAASSASSASSSAGGAHTSTSAQQSVSGQSAQASGSPRKDLIAKADTPVRVFPGQPGQNPITDVSNRDSSRDRTAGGRRRPDVSMCDAEYVGGPISFDLRAVDIREMLRFIYQNYGVNFIVDKSVTQVPVDITITGVPWNQVMNAVLRANRLGWVCEDQGRIVRIATLGAIKEEETERQAITDEKNKGVPLKTVIRHLKYARALGTLAGTGSGSSGAGAGGGGGAGAGGAGGGGGGVGGRGTSGGTLLTIISSRNSPRGKTEVDARTNSLIITDLPDRIDAIMAILDLLDKPEAQVEIEARIVVADRNFLRDLGVQLAGAIQNTHRGSAAVLETAPVTLSGNSLGNTTSGSSGSSGSSGGSGGSTTGQIGANIPFTPAQNALQATANTVLGLTSGKIGTGLLSAALSASESKGQIRTISTPRITAQDNMTAEIVNGVQIPVQTVSNNTVTTSFVTAALRLEITPQIVEETGEVTMHIVAENNTVNTSLANQFNGGTPGINTQSAESVMRVKDGGTAVMGGINIDNESTTVNSTPGLGSIPILGNLFKRKTVSRDNSEILFFISPRIVHRDAFETAPPPGAPGTRGSLVPNAPADDKVKDASPKPAPAVPASAVGSSSGGK